MSEKRSDDALEKAERFQRLFVAPMVDAVRTEVKALVDPLIASHAQTAKDIKELREEQAKMKSNEKKALAGWGVYATGLAAALGWGWGMIRSHFHWG